MDIQAQRTTVALNQRHGAGPGDGTGAPRLLDEMGLDGLVYDAQDPAYDLDAVRKQQSELERKPQDLLAYRQAGQDLVHQ